MPRPTPAHHSVFSTLRTTLCILAALAAVAISGSRAEAGTYIYGVDVSNDLWVINPVNQTTTKVLTSAEIYQTANALAWDDSRDHLFFANANVFEYWERSTNTIKSVGGFPLGLTADPNNAAFYNDAFWYFEHNSNILREAQITYVGGDPLTATPFVTAINSYSVLGMSAFGINTNSFGDIAIDTNTGTLYASTSRGRFYSVDLANPITSFTQIVASPGNDRKVGLQLSFDELSSTLYGHNYRDGNWYTIDTTTGTRTQIAGFNTLVSGGVGFRDLGGADLLTPPDFVGQTVPVPEPSSLALAVVGLLGLGCCRRLPEGRLRLQVEAAVGSGRG